MLSSLRSIVLACLLAAPCFAPAMAQPAPEEQAANEAAPAGTGVAQSPAQGPAPDPAPDPASVLVNPNITVVYADPLNPFFIAQRQRLQEFKLLENLAQFLSPLEYPQPITLRIDQCGGTSAPSYTKGTVALCYEAIEEIEQRVPRETKPGQPPGLVILFATVIQYALHEAALHIFDVFEVPVWGRSTDAADRLTAFVMLQFGPQVRNNTLFGVTSYLAENDRTWSGSDFSSARSPEAQRYFNYLCMAAGTSGQLAQQLVSERILPLDRARYCRSEYAQVQQAFTQHILPHTSTAKLEAIAAMEIFGQLVALDQIATPPQ